MTYIHGTAETEQERLVALNHLTNRRFVAFLELDESDAVLEVGSGLGLLAREVALHVPRGEVIGLERSPDQLRRASGGANVRFMEGDAHSLPFDEGRFDVVYCRYLLEHVERPARVVEEMYRVLARGGRLFVQENNILTNVFDPECPLFSEAWVRFESVQRQLGGDGQIGRKLLPLLRRAGFADVRLSIDPEVHWAGEPSFARWIENHIGNIEGSREALVALGAMTGEEIDAAVTEIRQFAEREDASTFFYWNRARARKP